MPMPSQQSRVDEIKAQTNVETLKRIIDLKRSFLRNPMNATAGCLRREEELLNVARRTLARRQSAEQVNS